MQDYLHWETCFHIEYQGFRRQPGKRVADKYMPPPLVGAGDEVILPPDQAKVWPKAFFLEHCLRFFALAKNRTRPVELRAAAVKTGLTNTYFLRPPAGFIWVGGVRVWSGVQRTGQPEWCLVAFPAFGSRSEAGCAQKT